MVNRFKENVLLRQQCLMKFTGPSLEIRREFSDGFKDMGFVFSKSGNVDLEGQPRKYKLIDLPATVIETQNIGVESGGKINLKLTSGFEYTQCALLDETGLSMDCPTQIFAALNSDLGLSLDMSSLYSEALNSHLRLKILYKVNGVEVIHVYHAILMKSSPQERTEIPLNGGTSTAKYPNPPSFDELTSVQSRKLQTRGVMPPGGGTGAPTVVNNFATRYFFSVVFKISDLESADLPGAVGVFSIGAGVNIDSKTGNRWNFYSNINSLLGADAYTKKSFVSLLQNKNNFAAMNTDNTQSIGTKFYTALGVTSTNKTLVKCLVAGKVVGTQADVKSALQSAVTEAANNGRFTCDSF
jgi:hypothetical protein